MSSQIRARYFTDSISTAGGRTTVQLRLHPVPMSSPDPYPGLIPKQINAVFDYSAADCSLWMAAATCSITTATFTLGS